MYHVIKRSLIPYIYHVSIRSGFPHRCIGGRIGVSPYYRTNVYIAMESETAYRTFHIRLREGEYHSVPGKIEFYSEGEPATNEPSKVPPIAVYLTHVKDR